MPRSTNAIEADRMVFSSVRRADRAAELVDDKTCNMHPAKQGLRDLDGSAVDHGSSRIPRLPVGGVGTSGRLESAAGLSRLTPAVVSHTSGGKCLSVKEAL